MASVLAVNGHSQAFLAAVRFQIDVQRERGGVRLRPIGEVDISTIEQVKAALDEAVAAGVSHVILDLRETTFLDSSGLHFAVDTHTWAQATRTEFSIIAGPPPVQRTFEVANLRDVLPFVDVP